jgi:hypothetical protein
LPELKRSKLDDFIHPPKYFTTQGSANVYSQTSDVEFIEIDKTAPKTNELKQALSISTLFSTYEREKVH